MEAFCASHLSVLLCVNLLCPQDKYGKHQPFVYCWALSPPCRKIDGPPPSPRTHFEPIMKTAVSTEKSQFTRHDLLFRPTPVVRRSCRMFPHLTWAPLSATFTLVFRCLCLSPPRRAQLSNTITLQTRPGGLVDFSSNLTGLVVSPIQWSSSAPRGWTFAYLGRTLWTFVMPGSLETLPQ